MKFNKSFVFLLVRGSIPLLWNQIVDLTYKYKFEMVRIVEYWNLRKKYGNILSIDLVNKHGGGGRGGGRLSEKFANAMQHVIAFCRYLHFNINLGDDIRIPYSGTPALKGDFVRQQLSCS
uniref:SAC domain-containing protein n=1 Tax=Solanum lycopersicum TaxID=4081 RepID=A0A3Q7F742_SOLLC